MLKKVSEIPVSAAVIMQPDVIADVQRSDRKQIILDRFAYRATEALPAKKHSPYWQPVDDEC